MNSRKYFRCFIFSLATVLLFSLPASTPAQDRHDARSIERISPESAKAALDAGRALLICSYDDQRCGEMMIPGAITRDTLARRQSSLPEDTELIFYCG